MERVDSENLSSKRFVEEFLVPNKPCVIRGCLQSWPIYQECQKEVDNTKDETEEVVRVLGTFLKEGTETLVPVITPIEGKKSTEYGTNGVKRMKLREYEKMLSSRVETQAYLKDWHFMKDILPQEKFYETPSYFLDDWLNAWCDLKNTDDYRFVYMGPKGSSTPLHHDVCFSYSWSANITGRKLWRFRDSKAIGGIADVSGQMSNSELKGLIQSSGAECLECVQEAGEVIFVPSGWFHEVENLETTLSLNHNWLNIYCLGNVVEFLTLEFERTERALDHLRTKEENLDDDDFIELVEKVLKLNVGLSIRDLLEICLSYLESQSVVTQQSVSPDTVPSITGSSVRARYVSKECVNHVSDFDSDKIAKIRKLISTLVRKRDKHKTQLFSYLRKIESLKPVLGVFDLDCTSRNA